MTAPATDRRSVAEVTTDRADRWCRQLSSHLGRKAEVRSSPDGTLLLLARGSCLLTPTATALRLHASAPDEEALERVQAVVGGHLERFAASTEAFSVVWRRS